MKPRALIVGPLPPPPGGVGRLVESILASPLAARWRLEVFNLSKPQQEGKPATVTPWDVAWTIVHLVALPWRVIARRPRVALVQSTADSGMLRDLALVLVLRGLRIPVVLHWHGAPESPQFPGPRVGSWRAALFRFVVARAHRVILLADPYGPFFARYVDPSKLIVVPNFVDGSRRGACSANPGRRAPHEVRLVFLGRVGPLKGTDALLDALAIVRRTHPDVRLELIGEGESAEALAAARSHPMSLAGAVSFTGALGEERHARLAAADVFVLPTRADSFPLAVIEAMAVGLPIVASAVGAIPWLLDEGACGLLVPAGDVEALAAALLRLAGNPAERIERGAAARARQAERFDSRGAAEVLDAVLREAAGLPARSAGGSA